MNNRAGEFVKVGSGISRYDCFVPEYLSPKEPNIQYDDELIYLISEANRYIGRLDEDTNTLISTGYFVYMFARKEAALSSHIALLICLVTIWTS